MVAALCKSPFWGPMWQATQDPTQTWPKDVQVQSGRLLYGGLVGVPENKVAETIRAFHLALGHPGARKAEKEIRRRFAFPSSIKLLEAVQEDRRQCMVCQACDHPNVSTATPIDHTHVPQYIMSHVAIDIFSLPVVEWKGQLFDAVVLCVDRLSGWMVVKLCTK